VPTADVVVGDMVRLRPGDRIPVDGSIVDGETDVDESLVTGESQAVRKRPGDQLVGGSINVSGAVTMRATKVGRDTVLAQIATLVEHAQASKAPAQRLADRAAAVLVVVAIGAGILTFAAWTISGATFLTALTFAISAVVIACPDALGLATPTAVAVGTGLGAKHNILIKDAATLEGVSRVRVVVFDKTGTITEGHPSVTDVVPADGVGDDELLRTAAAAGAQSTHPLSAAIVRAAAARALTLPAPVSDIENVPGMGLTARVNGARVLLGNEVLFTRGQVSLGATLAAGNRLAADGRSLVYVGVDTRVLGVIGITDANLHHRVGPAHCAGSGVQVHVAGDGHESAGLGHAPGIGQPPFLQLGNPRLHPLKQCPGQRSAAEREAPQAREIIGVKVWVLQDADGHRRDAAPRLYPLGLNQPQDLGRVESARGEHQTAARDQIR